MGSIKDIFGGDNKFDEIRPLLQKRSEPKVHAFSKAAILMYVAVFGSRYAFYAVETIMTLFLRNILLYSESASTIIYQLFDGFCNLLPLFLAIFADSIFGKYKTIVYSSGIFTIGNILIVVSAISLISISVEKLLMIFALMLMAVGQAGLISSQAPFGGDQFVIPQQHAEMDTFFATFYFIFNVASALANILTPMLRKNVHCFGQDTCYSLAFGAPVLLMLAGLVIFALGRRYYTMKPVTDSIIWRSFQSIAYALGSKTDANSEHWLDKASEKFGYAFVNDLKALLRIVVVFTPLMIFWSLWNQQSSTWTFQATRMSGYVTQYITIQPDQVQMTNSALLLIFIPAFELAIYPCLRKIGLLTKYLQRMGVGCISIVLAFVAAGMLELTLRKTYPVIPGIDQTSFNVINPLSCSLNVTLNPVFLGNNGVSNNSVSSYNGTIQPYKNIVFQNIPAVDYNISVILNTCNNKSDSINFTSLEYLSSPGTVHTFVIIKSTVNSTTTGSIISSVTNEDLVKSNEGNSKIRIIGVNIPSNLTSLAVTFTSNSTSRTFYLSSQDAETLPTEVDPDRYLMTISFQGKNTSSNSTSQSLGYLELQQGGSYLLLVDAINYETVISLDYVLTLPNSIHVVWQLPQYVLLTIGEVLVSITGYQFTYSQAPKSMKSLVYSLWLWQIGMGDLIIAVVTSFDVFPNQAITFFFYAILMLFGTAWFVISAQRYEARLHTVDPSRANSPISSRSQRRVSLYQPKPISEKWMTISLP